MAGQAVAEGLERKIAAVCLMIAPVVLLISGVLDFTDGQEFAAGVTGVVAFVLMLPGVMGLATTLRQKMPRYAVIAGILAGIGCIGGAMFSAANLHKWAVTEAGADAAMAAAIQTTTEDKVFPFLVNFGVIFPLAVLLLAIGLWRAKQGPNWIPIALGIGVVLFPFGQILDTRIVEHLAHGLILLGLVTTGLGMLRGGLAPVVGRAAA